MRNNSLNAEYEAAESVTVTGLAVSSVKGDVVLQTLSVGTDLSGTASAMPAWLVANSLPVGSGGIDSDGDGVLNSAEYAADTNPNHSGEYFRILEVTRTGGNNFVKFGPIRPDRIYKVWSSEVLGSAWSSVGQVTPGVTGDYFLFGHPTPVAAKLFYKLEVTAP